MVLLAVIYIYYRIWHVLPFSHLLKWATTLILFMPVCLFFGYMAYRSTNTSLWINQVISTVGTSWMIILLYLLMIFLVTDIARLLIPAIRPWFINSHYGTIGITVFLIITFVGGNLWYHHKVRVPLNIQIEKPMSPIKVVGISDLHLGYTIGKQELPIAIEFSIREWHRGCRIRMFVPWYSAFGMQGTNDIPPYENVMIELELK